METHEKLKTIKRSFRLYMNGVTAASLRKKGANYKIIWGVSQPDLRRMASEYGKDRQLAEALWKEDIRECKLLATLVMSADQMEINEAKEWMETAASVELVEFLVFNLFQYVACAEDLTCLMLESDSEMEHLAAYNLACRMLKKRVELNDETYRLLFGKCVDDLATTDRQLLHALVNCLQYMASLKTEKSKIANNILKEGGFDAF